MSDDQLLASDRDRERVAERLRRAQEEGRLTLAEFDQRVGEAYAARTYAQLNPLTRDLPAPAPVSEDAVRAPGERRLDGWAWARRIQLAAWAVASVVNLVIWAMVSAGAGGPVYPWWIWVAGPWGVALVTQSLIAGMVRRSGGMWPAGGCRGSYPV